MKFPRKIIITVLLMAIGAAILIVKMTHKTQTQTQQTDHKEIYYCPMHPHYTSDRPGNCPICYMKLVRKEDASIQGQSDLFTKEKKILYWTDPMIPGYRADKPGKSPMGMDLIPVYQKFEALEIMATEGHASVVIDVQKQQLIGVKTALVEKKKIVKTIRAVGSIAHDPELYQAQAEYIQAVQSYERSKLSAVPEVVDQFKRMASASRIRLKHFGLGDELIDKMSGWKNPDQSLLFPSPGDPLWVYAQVYEYEIPLIRLGQDVTVDVPVFSGERFKGKVEAIDYIVDAQSRTTRVRSKIEDPKGILKPDMYVNVNIAVDLGEVLAVPKEAILNTGKKQIVFIDKGGGLFEPREVFVGARADRLYEIKKGVKEGEKVVVSGNFLLDSESRIQSALEGMGEHRHE